MSEIISKRFMDIYKRLGTKYGHMEAFSDFVKISAIAIYNAIAENQKLEDEYLKIINHYEKNDQKLFPKWFVELVLMYENQEEPTDILGKFYQNENLYNGRLGQFFTPTQISDFMAEATISNEEEIKKKIEEKGFITLYEPTCGAGGMIISFAKALKNHNINYQSNLLVVANDISDICAYMVFIQLTLYGIPAIVYCGDTLTQKMKFELKTPFYFLQYWKFKDAFVEKTGGKIDNEKRKIDVDKAIQKQFNEIIVKGNSQISLW